MAFQIRIRDPLKRAKVHTKYATKKQWAFASEISDKLGISEYNAVLWLNWGADLLKGWLTPEQFQHDTGLTLHLRETTKNKLADLRERNLVFLCLQLIDNGFSKDDLTRAITEAQENRDKYIEWEQAKEL